MRLAVSVFGLALMQSDERWCEHPARGESQPLDVSAVERAYRSVERALAWTGEGVMSPDPLAAAYASGLPACRHRVDRRATVAGLPEELVGNVLHFGPRARSGAIHLITETRSLREVLGGVLATPELAERFGVRCAPTTVRVRSQTEVDVHEGD